ncbi:MAG: Biotin/lipoate A/B protein ligase [Trizodia sp. TS-e1964]|nr:MAG: Biotin/lipoate A/B protein ligase [Trizodia sp. TS-e1964]
MPPQTLRPLLRSPLKPALPTHRLNSTFISHTVSPKPYQIYISSSASPHLNLSIEHYLLQHTPPNSTVLFLYTNAPAVIIGRNQNPWREAHMPLLSSTSVPLLRRRSGGGTVWHDAGNLNYCAICPSPAFARDRYATVVAAALRGLGVAGVRVNGRHDIVMRKGEGEGELKISGSAYKLVRGRGLHHGTCLLDADLGCVGRFLASPMRAYMRARGVESVRSEVGNVGVGVDGVRRAVVREFARVHGLGGGVEEGRLGEGEGWVGMVVGEELRAVEEIRKGVEELEVPPWRPRLQLLRHANSFHKSPEWIYGQTPEFTISNYMLDSPPSTTSDGSPPPCVTLTVRGGKITSGTTLSSSASSRTKPTDTSAINTAAIGREFHSIGNLESWKEDILNLGSK